MHRKFSNIHVVVFLVGFKIKSFLFLSSRFQDETKKFKKWSWPILSTTPPFTEIILNQQAFTNWPPQCINLKMNLFCHSIEKLPVSISGTVTGGGWVTALSVTFSVITQHSSRYSCTNKLWLINRIINLYLCWLLLADVMPINLWFGMLDLSVSLVTRCKN